MWYIEYYILFLYYWIFVRKLCVLKLLAKTVSGLQIYIDIFYFYLYTVCIQFIMWHITNKEI